jgi:general secretion pathway protein L
MLDELLSRLDARGLRPDLITMRQGKSGGIGGVNLLPADKRRRKAITPQLVNLSLAILALLLLISAVSLPLLDKRNRIQELEPLLEQARKQADEAGQLRKKVDRLKANSQFLIDKKQSSLPVLQVMDELTRILPDDTWISRLDIKGSELQIQGQSSSAAALIPLIESSSILHNPRFRSPVTQMPRSEAERFHLSADIEGTTP